MMLNAVSVDEGRSAVITECAPNYEALVRVTLDSALTDLGATAASERITDSEAQGGVTEDLALDPGELACSQFAAMANTRIVLLPAGIDAMQRMSGSLPSGLKLTATPPVS